MIDLGVDGGIYKGPQKQNEMAQTQIVWFKEVIHKPSKTTYCHFLNKLQHVSA
jgi:hypothetical protein